MRNRTRLKAFALHSTANGALKRMDVLEATRGRRSVRAFRNEDVSQESVDELTEAGTCAPSAGNLQPWEFIVVREPEI